MNAEAPTPTPRRGNPRAAARARDAATSRVRRVSQAAFAAAAALAAVFAGVAASSTHAKSKNVGSTTTQPSKSGAVEVPKVTPPSLQSSGQAAPSPAPPAAPPAPSPSPPAVVSGGT